MACLKVESLECSTRALRFPSAWDAGGGEVSFVYAIKTALGDDFATQLGGWGSLEAKTWQEFTICSVERRSSQR